MWAPRPRVKVPEVGEYAVVWRDTEHSGDLYAGELTVDGRGVRLRGGAGRSPVTHEFGPGEIETVVRAAPRERIAGLPSLWLDLRSGRSLLLAGVMGAGIAYEILDALSALV